MKIELILAEQMTMKSLFTFLLIITAASAFAQATDSTTVDSTATDTVVKSESTSLPSVTVKDIDGNEVNIADYGTNGKLTIISYWATWCKPCIKELKNVNDLLDDWIDDYNVELVAVSVDDSRNMNKVKPFVSGMGWNFDVLLDPNGDLQRAMNVANPPVTFLVDTNGEIVYTHTSYVEGDEYKLEEAIIKAAGN